LIQQLPSYSFPLQDYALFQKDYQIQYFSAINSMKISMDDSRSNIKADLSIWFLSYQPFTFLTSSFQKDLSSLVTNHKYFFDLQLLLPLLLYYYDCSNDSSGISHVFCNKWKEQKTKYNSLSGIQAVCVVPRIYSIESFNTSNSKILSVSKGTQFECILEEVSEKLQQNPKTYTLIILIQEILEANSYEQSHNDYIRADFVQAIQYKLECQRLTIKSKSIYHSIILIDRQNQPSELIYCPTFEWPLFYLDRFGSSSLPLRPELGHPISNFIYKPFFKSSTLKLINPNLLLLHLGFMIFCHQTNLNNFISIIS
jgi:hypothetical protein